MGPASRQFAFRTSLHLFRNFGQFGETFLIGHETGPFLLLFLETTSFLFFGDEYTPLPRWEGNELDRMK